MERAELVEAATALVRSAEGWRSRAAPPDPAALGARGAWIAIDTETTGLEWAEDGSTLLMATLYTVLEDGTGWYGLVGADRKGRLEAWVRECVDAGCSLVFQNAKFDLHQLGWDPNTFPQGRGRGGAPVFLMTDVMMHLVDSRELKRLENLEAYWLGTDTKKQLKGGQKTSDIQRWPAQQAVKYALNDAKITYDVAVKAWRKLKLLGLEGLYRKEERYMRLLWRAERRGVRVDLERVDTAVGFLEKQLVALEERLYEKIGYTFNWASTKQLSKALYDDYVDPEKGKIARPINPFLSSDGIDHSKMAHKGRYNSAATSTFLLLEKANHPLASLVMALRETTKLLAVLKGRKAKSKNARDVSGWRDLAHRHQRGRDWIENTASLYTLHTSWNMTGTRTGRLSSSKPQLQNIPSDVRVHETQAVYSGDAMHRTEAYNLRRCLVAREGYTFVSLDHKQQEGRLFGVISRDPVMRVALEQRLDIHKMVAKLVWGTEDDLHREWAKTISFGLIYGMTEGSLQWRLNCTRQEANAIARQYFDTFPRIEPFLRECINLVKQSKFVRYWSGRYWREDEAAFAYISANAQVQGGSADLISIAALRCQAYLDTFLDTRGAESGDDRYHRGAGREPVGHLLLVVHDELVFEVLNEYMDEVVSDLLKLMEVPDLLGVPFPADVKVGKSYGEMEKLK